MLEIPVEIIDSYLTHAPVSLAIREVNRIYALKRIFAQTPMNGKEVLDIGCGDGHWWDSFQSENLKVYGIDISESELKQAQRKLTSAEKCDISKHQPFDKKSFDLAIGNCSLEHVYDLSGALANINRSLTMDAKFILFVPTPYWAHQGHLQKILMRISPRLSMMLSGAFNGFFQHWHLYDYKIWDKLLQDFGFSVEKAQGLGNQKTEFLFRLFLPTAFISFLIKNLFGFYPNRLLKRLPPTLWRGFANKLKSSIETSIVELPCEYAYEYVIVAKKISNV